MVSRSALEFVAAQTPSEALNELRQEWREAKADPRTSEAQLRDLRAMGRAVRVVHDVLGSRAER